jgi:N-acetylmuramoyl-L-alanine amidase
MHLEKRIRGGGNGTIYGTHKAHMPRVLVEMGFISNYTEGTGFRRGPK